MRNRVHNVELNKLVSNKIQGPASSTFGRFRTRDYSNRRFDLGVKSSTIGRPFRGCLSEPELYHSACVDDIVCGRYKPWLSRYPASWRSRGLLCRHARLTR
jgi:hypothetical protein